MRNRRFVILGFVIVTACFTGETARAQKLPASTTIGTNPAGSLFYSVASGLAQVISEAGPMQSVVQPYTGSSTFLPLLDNGELDFGIINAVDMGPRPGWARRWSPSWPCCTARPAWWCWTCPRSGWPATSLPC